MLDHDIHAFPIRDFLHFIGNFLLIVVDYVVCAQVAGFLYFAFVTGSGNYHCIKELCNLDGGDAHAGICTQHQDGMSRSYRGTAGQNMEGSEEDQRHAGSFVEAKSVGNRNHVHRRNCHQFAIAAIDTVAQHGELTTLVLETRSALGAAITEMHGRKQHTLTGLEAGDVLADLDYFSTDVAAQNVWQLYPW